jgi:hypothetical protein
MGVIGIEINSIICSQFEMLPIGDIKMQVAAKRVKDSLDQPTKSLKKINRSIEYNSRENGIYL